MNHTGKMAEMVEIKITVPKRLMIQVEKELVRQGADLEDLIRMALRRYVRLPDVFHLDTPMSFGQYKDELTETLIRTEPRYIVWCLLNIPGFTLSGQAEQLLHTVLPEEGVVVRQYEKGGDYQDVRVLPDEDLKQA